MGNGLQTNSKIESIYYPGLSNHLNHSIAKEQQLDPHGNSVFGGMISIDLGSLSAARKFVKGLNIFTLAESLGGVESLVCHPATMTHASIPEEIRKSLLYLLLPLKKINRKIDIYEKIFAIDDIFLYIALKNNPLINIYNKLPEFKEWCSDTFSNFKNHNLYEKSSFFDLINVMPNSRLNCFDLGSMSEGIELRSPFLNTKLFIKSL